MKQTDVNGFAADVTLHRFHNVHARFLFVGSGLDVKLRVERIKLDGVVMKWPRRRSAGA